jgi:hypothetical protein
MNAEHHFLDRQTYKQRRTGAFAEPRRLKLALIRGGLPAGGGSH